MTLFQAGKKMRHFKNEDLCTFVTVLRPLVHITEAHCVICYVWAMGEGTVEDLNVTLEHDRL